MFSFFIKTQMRTTCFKVVRPNEWLLRSTETSGLSENSLGSFVTLVVCSLSRVLVPFEEQITDTPILVGD